MFNKCTEETLDKVYDWLDTTYYSPYPVWKNYMMNTRERAIHALNDMRALYSGVGNNGWWETDRTNHLDDLQDIIPYSMNEVLWKNEEIRRYEKKHEEAREQWEYYEGDDTWDDDKEEEYFEEHAPDIVKMQGNKDGKLYKYTKDLFWDSVEWFLINYATETEMEEVEIIINN